MLKFSAFPLPSVPRKLSVTDRPPRRRYLLWDRVTDPGACACRCEPDTPLSDLSSGLSTPSKGEPFSCRRFGSSPDHANLSEAYIAVYWLKVVLDVALDPAPGCVRGLRPCRTGRTEAPSVSSRATTTLSKERGRCTYPGGSEVHKSRIGVRLGSLWVRWTHNRDCGPGRTSFRGLVDRNRKVFYSYLVSK